MTTTLEAPTAPPTLAGRTPRDAAAPAVVVPAGGLSIGEAATATGLSISTLRYYERDGLLLEPVERASSGHRRYGERDLRWITMLTRLRATGMPIREVRSYAALVRDGDGNEPGRLELLCAHRERVLAQLAEVQDHLAAIDAKIELYESKVAAAR